MKRNYTEVIVGLTLTAIVLAAVLVATPSQQAQAGMLNAQHDYSLLTSGPAAATDEALYVIDNVAQKMVVYKLDNGKTFKIIAAHDFSADIGLKRTP